jgi:hypothetical protein
MSSQQRVEARPIPDWRDVLITKPRLYLFFEYLLKEAKGRESFDLSWHEPAHKFGNGEKSNQRGDDRDFGRYHVRILLSEECVPG